MPSKPTTSQDIIDDFWKTNLTAITPPTRPFSILPDNVYAKQERKRRPQGEVQGVSVTTSYEEAVQDCEDKVAQIVAECRRNNIKYTDPHFDLDNGRNCLKPLTAGRPDDASDDIMCMICAPGIPACAKRVGEIFENPKFYVGTGPNVRDTRQGAEGDCWFISSIGSLCVNEAQPLLIQRVCPERARDVKVGVYGFVFHRNGSWFSEVVDDKLYLSTPDYDDCSDDKRSVWDMSHSRLDPDRRKKEFRKTFQCNSDALFFGSSANPNETWVPLLEKAYAKAHGDYGAIEGGFHGEGVEDLTGGVTTEIKTDDILDTDMLWHKGLLKVNKQFLFGAETRNYHNQDSHERQGIQDSHSYCVMKAVEYKGQRLVLIKNPWGQSEWNGPWSDGSKEWSAEALNDLKYQFGDDGIFWMPYEDFLQRYSSLKRTRLFSPQWNVTQKWTTVQVPWSGDYNDTRFEFTIPEATHTVVVLSKLDDRFFQGLEGQYKFNLAFRLHETGEEKYLIRGYSSGSRSASNELHLEAGTYDVYLQISGRRLSSYPKIEEVVKNNWLSRREKLIQVGLSYDLAQAMGQIEMPEDSWEDVESINTPSVASANGKDPPAKVTKKGNKKPKVAAGSLSPVSNSGANRGSQAEDEDENPDDVDEQDDDINENNDEEGGTSQAADDGNPPDDDDDEPEEDEKWNATCVVGLRVFCHQTAATIRVVTLDADDVDDKPKLDVDSREKDAAGSS